jgi:putative membrane protein
MMDGWYGGMGAGGWILMILLWVLLVAVIVWAGAQLFGTRTLREDERERPEDILDRRLARGEIDVDTYDALREKLHGARLAGR